MHNSSRAIIAKWWSKNQPAYTTCNNLIMEYNTESHLIKSDDYIGRISSPVSTGEGSLYLNCSFITEKMFSVRFFRKALK